MTVSRFAVVLVLALSALLSSCSAERPTGVVRPGSRLAPCPPRPNCVSSDASGEHAVEPFAFSTDSTTAWAAARAAVEALPRTQVVEGTPSYLHAECRSAFFGFVDDLELELRPDEKIIAVRSASRLGYGDLGVNRARVEELRTQLQEVLQDAQLTVPQ